MIKVEMKSYQLTSKTSQGIFTLFVFMAILISCNDMQDQPYFAVMPESEDFDAFVGTWSPDGTKILFQHTSHTDDVYQNNFLWIYDTVSRERELVFAGPAANPDWHPYEPMFVFHSPVVPAQIYTYNYETGELKKLTGRDSPNEDVDLRHNIIAKWSPDGSQILFTSGNHTQNRGAALMQKDGSNADLLIQYAVGVNWFPDGKNVIYQFSDHTQTMYARSQIFISDIEKLEPVQISKIEPSTSFLESLSISPDGSRVTFSNNPKEQQPTEIFIMDITGNDVEQLTRTPAVLRFPRWHPAGDRILFSARNYQEGTRRLYILDVATREIEAAFPPKD